MSTLKVINSIHPSGSTNNLVFDSSGNTTAGGTLAMSSSFLRNRIINGAMVIDQRNAGASATASSGYIYGTDRNRSYVGTPTARWSCQQSTDAPSGFTYSFLLTTTTAQTSFAAGDLGVSFEQAIEGYNIADLAWGTASAKTVTVSFWIKASIAGAYAVAVFNSNAGTIDRSYPTSVTVNAVNTWEYKTVTIPGDTTGVWQTANNIGIFLAIGAFGGSNFVGTANTWQSGLKEYPSGCVNIASTVGATLRLTGVQFEVGSVATPFERRLYGQELALCQRYYQKAKARQFGGVYESATILQTTTIFLVEMRATPTVTRLSNSTWGTNAGGNTNTTSFNFVGASIRGCALALSATGNTVSVGIPATCETDNFVDFSAEL